MPKLEVVFEREKETKNTVKFQEVVVEGDTEIVGTLYVQKWAMTHLGQPNRLKVTVESE